MTVKGWNPLVLLPVAFFVVRAGHGPSRANDPLRR